ncbi:polyprenyl synthetase family protein [Aureimonas populi]|uniref:Polyprenyl synthetase family protein n=1 Tax=Aureimonas populi TaxID=1701758 RepID=A0ABW5CPV7_9HYPH|nr:polyprenyl synthetase family protein [Aureimonas populi]
MVGEGLRGTGELLQRIDARLAGLLPAGGDALGAAMADAALAPGKRLRPLMTMIVAEDLGGPPDAALDVGCAVEMVHAASLVLDDLPCMDDAALRRGRPALHRAHGEDVAVLAAVSLLTQAFGIVAATGGACGEARLECLTLLSGAVGTQGLAAGQLNDLHGGRRARPLAEILATNSLKTGALFAASVEAGAVLAGAQGSRPALRAFADEIGQAFQLLDDLLDHQPMHVTGKDPGRDEGKSTVVSMLGAVPVEKRIERHLAQAHIHLEAVFGPRSRLAALVDDVFARTADMSEQEAGAR